MGERATTKNAGLLTPDSLRPKTHTLLGQPKTDEVPSIPQPKTSVLISTFSAPEPFPHGDFDRTKTL